MGVSRGVEIEDGEATLPTAGVDRWTTLGDEEEPQAAVVIATAATTSIKRTNNYLPLRRRCREDRGYRWTYSELGSPKGSALSLEMVRQLAGSR